MTTEQRKELATKIGGLPLIILSWIQLFALLLFICSLFVCIWHSWSLGWRLGLTAFLSMIIIAFIYDAIKKTISNEIDKIEKLQKESNSPVVAKSKFQLKLEQLAKEKGIII